MIFPLFRKSANRTVIERLHGAIVEAARDPVFFTEYGVADTFEGRFEAFALLSAMALRRLNALDPPGPDVAQDLSDAIFKHFEVGLREIGVGDASVPMRMKKLAESFHGRAVAYDRALRADEAALAAALDRNVFGNRPNDGRLTRFTAAAADALNDARIEAFTIGPIPFPAPSGIL